MRKTLKSMCTVKAELRKHPEFYAVMGVGYPILYAALLWFDNWGSIPAN